MLERAIDRGFAGAMIALPQLQKQFLGFKRAAKLLNRFKNHPPFRRKFMVPCAKKGLKNFLCGFHAA